MLTSPPNRGATVNIPTPRRFITTTVVSQDPTKAYPAVTATSPAHDQWIKSRLDEEAAGKLSISRALKLWARMAAPPPVDDSQQRSAPSGLGENGPVPWADLDPGEGVFHGEDNSSSDTGGESQEEDRGARDGGPDEVMAAAAVLP